MNKNFLFAVMVLIFLVLLSPVLAEYYTFMCWSKGQVINFTKTCAPGRPVWTCTSDICKVCVKVKDDGKVCHADDRCNENDNDCLVGGGNSSLDIDPPDVNVSHPVNRSVYGSRSINLKIALDEQGYISYVDNSYSYKRNVPLCNLCYGYDRVVTFSEGYNNINIVARDTVGNIAESNLVFTVDSVKPRIYKTGPLSGFADGNFMAQFVEQNPVSVLLHYGKSGIAYNSKSVNIGTECATERGTTTCNTFADISPYDPGTVEYWFEVTDIGGNSVESSHISLKVDTIAPKILNIDVQPNGAYVTFTLEINEQNFLSAQYYENINGNGRWMQLCNRLVNNICTARARFADGEHDIDIKVDDKAGNSNTIEDITFFTDSMPPRILSYSPTRGFADGTFTVKFIEQNPTSLVLNYGNNGNYNAKPLDLANDCAIERGTYTCETHVDLSAYNPGNVEYWFKLTDRAGASAETRKTTLQVDTTDPEILNFIMNPNGAYVEFNLEIDETNFAYVEYKSSNPGRWTSFCRSLRNNQCSGRVRFSDGEHIVDIRVVDQAGNSNTIETITFFTDSMPPRILSYSPMRGFADGTFTIKFMEQNPTSLMLNYGNNGAYNAKPLDLANDCAIERGIYTCETHVDLSAYDPGNVEYWFKLTDRAGASAETRKTTLQVDTTPPEILNINVLPNGAYVTFNLEINEQNFLSAQYYELVNGRGRWMPLCNRLVNNICTARVRFADGEHDIDIKVDDKAGNSNTIEDITFFTDSMPPRILSYSPMRGFADGTFTVKFMEQNPTSLVLNYGNNGAYNAKPLDLVNDCTMERGIYTCETHVDLSAYNPGNVEYWFKLTDRAGASAETRKTTLQVDMTPPEILSINTQQRWSYVTFTLEINEQNFLIAEYYDHNGYGRWMPLCNWLYRGVCTATRGFSRGPHDLDIRVTDKAGNSDMQSIDFEIDY